MATKKWFVVADEGEVGPLGPNGLRKLVRKGDVIPGTMIRREDHEYAVRADHVRGLFGAGEENHHPQPKIHGPFTSLRAFGWFTAGALGVWVVVGIVGVLRAWSQRTTALEIVSGAERPLLDAGAPFVGLGGVVAAVLFFATGVMFSYWLWCARVNLPHLIQARIRFAPSWTVVGWFLPPVNLIRPYQVIEEVDRLSAEAAADGDASVKAESALLVPWWICTLLLVGSTVAYKFMPVATAEQIAAAAFVHLIASAAIVPAAAFGAVVLLRISRMQELAHDSHPNPVQLHRVRAQHRQQTASG